VFSELLKQATSVTPATLPTKLPELFKSAYEARLLESELDLIFKSLQKAGGVRASSLRKDWERYLGTRDSVVKQEAAAAPVPPDVEAAADALLVRQDLLAHAIDTIGKLGVVGERANRGLLYLAHTSRLMPEPISVLLKGRSAGGKSNLEKQTLKLMPPESYYELTALSSKALIYADIDLQHKHLVIYEEDGNEESEYLVRTLLSEGHITYLTTEKTAAGLKGRLIERPGPTGLVTTMTRANTREDNESRAWSLYVDDSKAQTLAVVGALAEAATGVDNSHFDARPWQVMQRKLEPLEVVIEYAPALAKLLQTDGLPSDSTRLRRDFKRLLTLVQAVALLYQRQRERDSQGRLLATLDDYRMAHELAAGPFAESARELSPQALKLARAIREVYEAQPPSNTQPVTPRQLEGHLRWTRPTVLKWLGQVEAAGLAEVETGRGNTPTRVTPLGAAPSEALALLPSPEELQKSCVGSSALCFNAKPKQATNAVTDATAVLKLRKTALNVVTREEGQPGDTFNAVNVVKGALNAETASPTHNNLCVNASTGFEREEIPEDSEVEL
jgi:DNA-binding MarR family transcriptional regulator